MRIFKRTYFFAALLTVALCSSASADIAFISEERVGANKESLVYIVNPDGGTPETITDKEALGKEYRDALGIKDENVKITKFMHRNLAVSEDGRRIAYAGYRNFTDGNLEKWGKFAGRYREAWEKADKIARPQAESKARAQVGPEKDTKEYKAAYDAAFKAAYDPIFAEVYVEPTPSTCTGAMGKPLTEELYHYGYAYFPSTNYRRSLRNYNWNIFIYDTTTGKEKQATSFHWDEGQPQFLKRGGNVLYSLSAQKSVFMLKTAGTKRGFIQIILMDNEVVYPQISPDGRYLVFQSYIDGNWEVYTLKLAESYKDRLKTRLTRTSEVSEVFPHWLDDHTVVYAANRAGGSKYDYYSMDVKTGKKKRLTRDGGAGAEMSVAKDGRIVYSCQSKGMGDIAVVGPDGGEVEYLTTGNDHDRFPVWSPDGKRIAFISNKDGAPQLYVINAEGSGQRRVTTIPCAWDFPVWY